MHATQSHIMSVLSRRSPRRYSELRPREVEGNVFMHHLRAVMAAGLVERVPDGAYALTVAGQRFVMSAAASSSSALRAQPRILVETACRNERGEWLLYRWGREPFRGLVGLPGGHLLQGERVTDGARRELREKTGYEATVEHVGNLYATTYRDGELLSYLLTHICIGTVTGGERPAAGAFWQALDAAELAKPEYFPGLAAVLDHLAHRPAEGQFFGEYSFEAGATLSD